MIVDIFRNIKNKIKPLSSGGMVDTDLDATYTGVTMPEQTALPIANRFTELDDTAGDAVVQSFASVTVTDLEIQAPDPSTVPLIPATIDFDRGKPDIYIHMRRCLQDLWTRLGKLDAEEPKIVHLRNQEGQLVELTCSHGIGGDGQIHRLTFYHQGVPITAFHVTQFQNGGMEVAARYNHNTAGVLLPMHKHEKTFKQLPPLSNNGERFTSYLFTLNPDGSAPPKPQVSHNYEDKSPGGNGDFRSVPLDIPTAYPGNYLPFMGHIVHQIVAAVAAIPTSA
ncbi:MAG: hypothetical protein NUV65_00210 [Candidatus Roizmanbacteria bacterium]|nr:hypothetical protein [Candidatus Roizmanbacteria bacterium]